MDCYNDKKTGWLADPSRNEINENVLSIVKTLEETYNCSGLCQKPLFWAHKSVTEGGPQKACIYQLKDDFDGNAVWIGWLLAFMSLSVLTILMCHCGLYFNNDEDLLQASFLDI